MKRANRKEIAIEAPKAAFKNKQKTKKMWNFSKEKNRQQQRKCFCTAKFSGKGRVIISPLWSAAPAAAAAT